MDILIKNMEMPKGCFCCPLSDKHSRFDGNEWHCGCFVLCKEVSDDGDKDEDCPLIPVPEHGDLIDRDKEINEWEQTKCILSECEQKHTFDYRKACVIISALSQAEVVLERTT